MWTPFLYQHLVGGLFMAIAFVLYFTKTDKELLKAQGRSLYLLPLFVGAFYLILNFAWTWWALGGL